jgi:diguanylate cyclase (GGDEF)-like protein/PAS domain S-box-containing protein
MAHDVPAKSAVSAVNMTRNEMGVIVSVAESLVDLLGWRPEQLIGCKSHQFVHPEDQASAIAAWVSMVTTPGTAGYWRGRYQRADGNWQWVETTNRLENPDLPVVYTSMTPITVEEVSIEEELRARTQMLSRLSDALPVGLFEIDTARRIKFTNDRLHLIVGLPPAATIGAQLMNLADEDQLSLELALSAVLADQLVDDIEIRIHDASRSSHRICLLSLRALTDGAGAVSGAIGLLSDVTDRVQLRSELEIRASVDQLTSCLNRAAILERLGTALTQDDSASRGTAVVYIDLDRFKPVNDLIGHAAGDRLLAEVADRLRLAVRARDHIGRMGGDEFLVVCPGVKEATRAVEIGERIASFLHGTVDVGLHKVDLSASIGVAWTSDLVDGDVLIAQADAAMYQSKRGADSKVTLYETREPATR